MKDKCSKCFEVEAVLNEWIGKQGHDRCWYYPDLFLKLVEIAGVQPHEEVRLPPRDEFETGCGRYQDEQYSKLK
jgi:hypothetical protein